jgi:haloacid dehalogenase superfamily, subfamily IA, variant 3 with third motif having DD or ED
MPVTKKAIFWDNDGVLVDTERYYFEATRCILNSEGIDLTQKLYVEFLLKQSIGAWHLLDPQKYSADAISDLRTKRDELYRELLLTRDILIEGVDEVVSELSRKYRMAIVTSSKPGHFQAIHSHTGLLRFFEFAVTADDYTHFKPDPEPYLAAMKRMGVSPEEAIAIEDSPRGLVAATSAGLNCIIIKNELTQTCDFSSATHVLDNIQQLLDVL